MGPTGADLIAEARKRAGLTQRELAERAGTTQSSIARWESARSEPSFVNVVRLLRVCGYVMDVHLERYDDGLRDVVPGADRPASSAGRDRGERPPAPCPPSGRAACDDGSARGERRMRAEVFDPTAILEALARHEVQFVVIGGLAARLHGSPLLTEDVGITPSTAPDNLQRLSDALRDLQARVRHPDAPDRPAFAHDATSLAGSVCWDLTTAHGDLDLSFAPAGTAGYPDLARDAIRLRLGSVEIAIASLADVVRSKDADNRDEDRRALPVLRELLAQQREQRDQ